MSDFLHTNTTLVLHPSIEVDERPVQFSLSVRPKRDFDTMDANGGPLEATRRLPNYTQVTDDYAFQQEIDARLLRIGVTQTREDNLRLAGVQWIDQTRKAMNL